MPREYPTVLDLVGGTPIVRLDRLSPRGHARILAKLEYLNPGGSVKDRIGLAMIEQAEREGKLKPGGTIVEPTSGNTGVGLAIAAAGKGYRCVFVMPDKMSQEKISMLRAYGAEVVITPTAVDHDSPESYYSVSSRLAEEIPGGFKPDQYSNMANPQAHYDVTAPEIWEQTGDEVDALVISVGTGGTISGVGRWFHERKPEVKIVGVDPEGSIYTAEDESQLHPYLVEGIGKDTWPDTIDLKVVDEWIRVSDRDSFLLARRLAPDGRRAAGREARRRGARARHDHRAREGRRGHRHDAALRHLAAAGRARRPVRVARGRDRVAAGSRAARARLRQPGLGARGRRRRDAAAAGRDRGVGDARRGVRDPDRRHERGRRRARGEAGRRPHALRPSRFP